jgi:STE24 endopeptidase
VAAVLVVLVGAAVLVAARAVPWRWPRRPARAAEEAALAGIPADEVAKGRALRKELRPVRYAGMLVDLGIALLLGLTPLGAAIVTGVASLLGVDLEGGSAGGSAGRSGDGQLSGGQVTGGWQLVAAVVGGLVVVAVPVVVGMPFTARRRSVLRRYGLLTQTFAGFVVDLVKGAALGVVLGGLVLAAYFWVVAALPELWWLVLAGAAAALAVLMSLVFPVLIEPVFNKFTPMAESPLRTGLLALAAGDGIPVRDVLVADASRRTRAVNAYVSGFGPTRRIVVYDTLLEAAPDGEVTVVVAHELGHARYRDVVTGTALGALGAAAGACALYLVGGWAGLFHLGGSDGPGDPRAMGLLMALATVAGLLGGPASAAVTRRAESRADAHSLVLTGDPETFAAMHRRLATRNLADPDPPRLEQLLFGTHPTTVQRIAMGADPANYRV